MNEFSSLYEVIFCHVKHTFKRENRGRNIKKEVLLKVPFQFNFSFQIAKDNNNDMLCVYNVKCI